MRPRVHAGGGVRLLLVAVAALASVHGGRGQMREPSSAREYGQLSLDFRAPVKTPDARAMIPMDAPVDPSEYVVGPGDILSVNIWSSTAIEHQLAVTPEGTLLIPNIGEVVVRDRTLASAKKSVNEMVGGKYINAAVTVTLLVPRKMVVEIVGNVVNEGKHEVYAVQRVDDLIAISNRFTSDRMTLDEYARELSRRQRETSERWITVKGRDGSTRHVDLVKFRAFGRGKDNPYLREGDVVYVPARQDQSNLIGVFGGTNRAVSFEYVPGDSLTDLIAIALGFRDDALPDHAVLSRLTPDGRHMDTLQVDARAIAERRAANIAVRPGDRLVIPERPELRQNYRVAVQGEVAKPGTYPITRGGTRLSDVLRAAGGLTAAANLRAASLLRFGETSMIDAETDLFLDRRTILVAQDSAYYLTETALRRRWQEVGVDFHALVVDGDSSQDVVLQHYDRVQIPPLTGTVYVFGQVISPGHIAYVPGAKYDYYISRAGGFTGEARTGDVMVITGKSRQWLDPDETEVYDGDFIWVPKEEHIPFIVQITPIVQVAGILATLASIVLVARTF